ncbi:MAG TPA: tripartite tricarboxylate transporter substrate-binding protein, partial [Pseudolabrys sp.]
MFKLRVAAIALTILIGIGTAFVGITTSVTSSVAQSYPSRPVTMIVPFAAGGPTDALARVLADRMRVTLGETVLVENVTGAGGTIGVTRAVKAAPDGYTLSVGHLGTHVINGAMYTLPFDLVNDLDPIAMV